MSSNKDPMEIDSPAYGGDTNKNGLHLFPVSVNSSGKGLPYAPENWPKSGDMWVWKVGKRIAASGYFLDRYLYLPKRLREKRSAFASKLSIEQYIRSEFPSTDIKEFFDSFSWKIPSRLLKGRLDGKVEFTPPGMISDSGLGSISCKAGNRLCASLTAENPSGETMNCDICCSEPGFCRDCCCILCCKIISPDEGGYSYVRCEKTVVDGYMCGHIAHINCALRAYMAGTVGGSIGLDTEYFCRRCDSRTDLVSHVVKLLSKCEYSESRDEIEKILNIGVCILRGSRKENAKQLLQHIELAMAKLNKGACIQDLFKKEEPLDANGGASPHHTGTCTSASTDYGRSFISKTSSPRNKTATFDHRAEILKLDDEVDQILQALKESQEFEYRLAEQRLFAQKKYIFNIYEQLDKERSELSSCTSMIETDTLLDVTLKRVEQLKREVLKLKEMKQVQNGFGSTSKKILKDYFGLEAESKESM